MGIGKRVEIGCGLVFVTQELLRATLYLPVLVGVLAVCGASQGEDPYLEKVFDLGKRHPGGAIPGRGGISFGIASRFLRHPQGARVGVLFSERTGIRPDAVRHEIAHADA